MTITLDNPTLFMEFKIIDQLYKMEILFIVLLYII